MTETKDNKALEQTWIQLGKSIKICVSLKYLDGKEMLDVRKWVLWANMTEFVPTTNAIMISLDDWRLLIPLIEDYLARHKQPQQISRIDKSA